MNSRCPNDGTLLPSPYARCPICGGQVVKPNPAVNPRPSQFPSGKHKVVKYCNNCDHTIVRQQDFDKCPKCGGHVY